MALPREMIEERMAAFKEACARRHVKLTHQRLEIYRAVAAREGHPDA